MIKDKQLLGILSEPGGKPYQQDFSKTRLCPELSQFIVADGLGGHGGGEIASKIAVRKMLITLPNVKPDAVSWHEYFSPDWLAITFEVAHAKVKQLQQEEPDTSHMATTMLVLMIMDNRAIWGHVGDSRLYLIRQGQIIVQTKDHSVPQMLVSSGEIELDDIRHHPDRNRLLRAIGDTREKVQARVHEPFALQEGDVFLLCTDGFWEYVCEEEMLESLYESTNAQDWLDQMEQRYLLPKVNEERVQDGLEKADNDNYTAMAIWMNDLPSKPLNANEEDSQAAIIGRVVQAAKEVMEDFEQFRKNLLSPKAGKRQRNRKRH